MHLHPSGNATGMQQRMMMMAAIIIICLDRCCEPLHDDRAHLLF
jgi:hypothetical protein